jgi:hypothetical protein
VFSVVIPLLALQPQPANNAASSKIAVRAIRLATIGFFVPRSVLTPMGQDSRPFSIAHSKQLAKLVILFASPKDSFVRSFKNSADPFQHDALPDE